MARFSFPASQKKGIEKIERMAFGPLPYIVWEEETFKTFEKALIISYRKSVSRKVLSFERKFIDKCHSFKSH